MLRVYQYIMKYIWANFSILSKFCLNILLALYYYVWLKFYLQIQRFKDGIYVYFDHL